MLTFRYLWVKISCNLTPGDTRGHCQKATSTLTMRAIIAIRRSLLHSSTHTHTHTVRTASGRFWRERVCCGRYGQLGETEGFQVCTYILLRTEEERARSLWRERPGCCRQPTEKRNSRSHYYYISTAAVETYVRDGLNIQPTLLLLLLWPLASRDYSM